MLENIDDYDFSDALSGKLDLTQYFSFYKKYNFFCVSLCKILFSQLYKSSGFEYWNYTFFLYVEVEVVLVGLQQRKQYSTCVIRRVLIQEIRCLWKPWKG